MMGLLWFLVLAAVEVWSIIQMSHFVGGLATFILLLAGFIFGLQLMRAQGINAMIKSAQNMQHGESPLAPLADGIVKAFAGILLLIPGFVTDVLALLLLLPFVRKAFARYLAKKGQFQAFASGGQGFGGFGTGGFGMGGFKMGGFNTSANDDSMQGNVYEHEGSITQANVEVIEAQVVEIKPEKKD